MAPEESIEDRPAVLVVDDDPSIRFLVRVGLEAEGVDVIEAESLTEARALLDENFEAVVLDRQLPDGAGDSLVPELLERLPRSRVIVHSSSGPLPGLPSVTKGDVHGLAAALDLHTDRGHIGARAAQRAVGRLHREWLELCRWDPALAPDARPPVADSVIRGVTEALERPQPLGWGLDPALDSVASAFGLNAGDVRTALAELVCLREAFTRVVIARLPDQQLDAARRLQMIIDRFMLGVAESGFRRLSEQALTDPLTGLGNRRAFEQDLERELARANRHDRPVTVAVIDVDGLKRVNDTSGHAQGDELLRRLAGAIRVASRAADRGYRLGGDEFALILTDSVVLEPDLVSRRLMDAGAPPITVGLAASPPDDAAALVERADQRLYDQRRQDRSPSTRDPSGVHVA